MTHVTYNSQTAVINLPHNKYVDRVLRSESAPVLLEIFKQVESPSKELSESYAAFHNLKKFVHVGDSEWLHIGDGSMARTAAIFAFFSKGTQSSIDPALNLDKVHEWINKYDVERLDIYKSKFEDLYTPKNNRKYNICLVHAHVNVEEVDKKFPNWEYLYTNPCCHEQQQIFSKKYMQDHNIECLLDKIDLGILSDKRRVVIYRKHIQP